ncbi:MAG: SOS response-associated peptidase [Planctomycetes bacterium]|nr:SOS response-associated peptidase [Planctomycetota bacterium]
MCNRYRLNASPDELIDLFDLPRGITLRPIAAEFYPGKPVPVVSQRDGVRSLGEMTWGFPPFKGKRPVNNTRSEQAASSSYWSRHLMHRCAFPLSEAVEWQHRVDTKTGEVRKVPHTIGFRDGRVAAVAGIYHASAGEACCSMMTCRANRLWSSIHNADPDDPRMICFLPDAHAINDWLDPERPYTSVQQCLAPLPDDDGLLVAAPYGEREKDAGGDAGLFG